MAGLDSELATIIGGVFAAVFWILAAFIAYVLYKSRKEAQARKKRRSARRASRKYTDQADHDPNFWQDGDDSFSDDSFDSFGSEKDYQDPGPGTKFSPDGNRAKTAASFTSLRSDNLNLQLFNRSFKEDDEEDAEKPVTREASDYDNILPIGKPQAGATGGGLHHSVRNMSVRYERGKEITTIVPGTTSNLAAPAEAWRSSAYEEVEEDSFVPPSNRSDPNAGTVPAEYLTPNNLKHRSGSNAGTAPAEYLTPDTLKQPSASNRQAVESVCYETFEEPDGESDGSKPTAKLPAIAAEVADPFDHPSALKLAWQSPVQPPPPTEPPPVADITDDSAVATTNYENFVEQARPARQPAPPSEPPPPDAVDMTDTAIATTNYENLGDQDISPAVKPPPPNEAPPPLSDSDPLASVIATDISSHAPETMNQPFDDPRGAVVSVCYENLGDQPAPTIEKPSEDPFNYQDPKVASLAPHMSMYENPEEYSDGTLKKARETTQKPDASAEAAEKEATAIQEDTLPASVSAYQTGQEVLDAGMSDISMRSRAITITAGF